jgi:uncharacterized membrane protein
MSIYRDIGILEVAKFIAIIAMAITFLIGFFLFPMLFGNSNDTYCMAIILMFIVGAITYIAFINREFNKAPERDTGEIKNKHVGWKKHRKSK